MALQRGDEPLSGLGRIGYGIQESVTVGPGKQHPLMLVQNPTRALVGEIAGVQTGHRRGMLDQPLRGGRKTKLHALGLALSGLDGWR